MGAKTGIEWTDATWNPIRAVLRHKSSGLEKARVGWHCTKVSEGCKNCYAERMNQRLGTGLPYTVGTGGEVEIFMDEKLLAAPLHWRKPRRIFVGSMTDLFGEFVSDEMIRDVFAVMASATVDCGKNHPHEEECWCGPKHTFQVLTKRPERMMRLIRDVLPELIANTEPGDTALGMAQWPLENVWLGVSVENQETADARIPLLLQTPAARRFVSYEPALGPVDFTNVNAMTAFFAALPPHERMRKENNKNWPQTCPLNAFTAKCPALKSGEIGKLDWVICGGESGPGARPMHPDWARSVRDQCVVVGVPFFFKQWGEWIPIDRDKGQSAFDIWGQRGRGIYVDLQGIASEEKFNISAYEDHSTAALACVGKKRAGRLLDGREWNEMP